MIALLLNSGLGSRMGDETREHPKCMCRLTEQETIISWQVKLLRRIGLSGKSIVPMLIGVSGIAGQRHPLPLRP